MILIVASLYCYLGKNKTNKKVNRRSRKWLFSGLAHGGKNVTYRTAECRNRLIVGDLWALRGAEGHVVFLPQSCRPQT